MQICNGVVLSSFLSVLMLTMAGVIAAMAELIGGSTVHTWGVIPANPAAAANKTYGGKDVDWDKLFENVLSMRWNVYDEFSAMAADLFSYLESGLREKACKSLMYAHRDMRLRKKPRPFGGINVILTGDMWQLPPVLATPLFANPECKGKGEAHAAGVQRVLSMLWDMHDPKMKDVFQELRELDVCKRNDGDAWLLIILEAHRHGKETWEMYSFTHGLATRNPGSWLPDAAGVGKGAPACGDELCKTLAHRWELAWQRGTMTWLERQQMECELCQAERKRRCRIISQRESDGEHMAGKFVSAPFVHPFRAPTNHAQRLRSLHFARVHGSRVFWVVAHDAPKDVTKSMGRQRTKWLTYDDRQTGGIVGLLPLVLDLPVKFTMEPDRGDRLNGVFTNARGWLRGWDLPPQEEERIKNITTAEVVLEMRPTYLYVEMRSGNLGLPLMDGKRIYRVRPQWRTWHVDQAKAVEIRRCGFPIVPDFGGTAHAYCGTSLEAAIGDLLDWWQRPSREAAIRGYIIISRVGRLENLLLAKPYCPALFRLGPSAGPAYLLQVLRGELTRAEAMKKWQQEEEEAAAAEKREAENGRRERWPLAMELECRHCMKLLPITAFTTSSNKSDIWSNTIAKGADLACLKCLHLLGLEHMPTEIIFCDGCQKLRRLKFFSLEMKERWRWMVQSEPIHCKSCQAGGAAKGRDKASPDMYPCCGTGCSCEEGQVLHTELDFLEADLVEAVARKVSARCARCTVAEDKTLQEIRFECHGCKEEKQLKYFSAVVCKQYLLNERRQKKRCYECQYPQCAMVGCTARPQVPVGHNHVEADGKWFCHPHRYPPCCVCRREPRPLSAISGKIKFKDYLAECA